MNTQNWGCDRVPMKWPNVLKTFKIFGYWQNLDIVIRTRNLSILERWILSHLWIMMKKMADRQKLVQSTAVGSETCTNVESVSKQQSSTIVRTSTLQLGQPKQSVNERNRLARLIDHRWVSSFLSYRTAVAFVMIPVLGQNKLRQEFIVVQILGYRQEFCIVTSSNFSLFILYLIPQFARKLINQMKELKWSALSFYFDSWFNFLFHYIRKQSCEKWIMRYMNHFETPSHVFTCLRNTEKCKFLQ